MFVTAFSCDRVGEVLRGLSVVLVDESAETVASCDRLSGRDRDDGGWPVRWVEIAPAVWPLVVVVVGVGLEHALEVTFADDEEPVEALGATVRMNRWAYALAFGARHGVWMISMPSARKTSSKVGPETLVPIMDAGNRRWRFYTTPAGRSPVRDFLADARLPTSDRDEILAAMKDVQVNGLEAARHLQGELYEVRADGRQATYRVLFATEGARRQILLGLSAFSKTTQKTPPGEIALAVRRLRDWRARAIGRRRATVTQI